MAYIKKYFVTINEEIDDDKVWMDVSSMYVYKNFSDIEKAEFDLMSTSSKINELAKKSWDIRKEVKKKIRNGNFTKIKFDTSRDLFYVFKSDFDQMFSGDIGDGILARKEEDLEILLEQDDDETKLKIENTETFPNIEKITDLQIIDIDNGMSIIAKGIIDGVVAGIIFDAGDGTKNRTKSFKKIENYFLGINKIIMILSHDHNDHFSIARLEQFRIWIEKKESTIICYKDSKKIIKLLSMWKFKNKILLDRRSVTHILGCAYLQTSSVIPKTPHEHNLSSMVFHIGSITFTGDQNYENIPDAWKINQDFFQVPHHGSIHSGTFMSAHDNFENAVPKFKSKSLPHHDVESHFLISFKVRKPI